MATQTASALAQNFGSIVVDGVRYIEQVQIFSLEIPITQPFQVLLNQQFSFPGTANFLYKGASRDIIVGGRSNAIIRFRFRAHGFEGNVHFYSGGLGMFNDRVFDQLAFGTGQFPFLIVPPQPVTANSSFVYEVEDVTGIVPYTIHIAFHGSYLIPTVTQP